MFDPDEAPDLPHGWAWDDGGEAVICPCGHAIELDCVCPEGHSSPLLGMI
ncbi:hypothetical protein [Nonomuraea sp. NPDC049784]